MWSHNRAELEAKPGLFDFVTEGFKLCPSQQNLN